MQGLTRLGRFALRWCAPEGVADLLRRARGRAAAPPPTLPADVIARNADLAGRHAGRRCFILATGPSIRTQDLSPLAGELCIAVSHFFLHPDIRRIRPAYHVLAPYHPPFDFDALDTVFDGFDAHYDDGVRYIFGHRPYAYSVWDYLRQRPHRCPEHAYFVDYGRSEQLSDANHRRGDVWDLAGRPFEPRTVLYVAIQAAAYMGCSEIVLLGCDHDYLADMTRVTNHHFYREEDGVSDVEHLSAFTTERWFEEYYFRWRQYRLMRQALAARGVTIINATAGGMLDVFSRANLAELLDAAAVGAGV
ncbi:MAG: hypothetical protein GX591_03940 [Planctomycetes bacterium]|nr:hypothetical protein [Planctomycetota bacterium]